MLVKFSTKKSSRFYAGQIESVNESGTIVRFLRKESELDQYTHFKYPELEDVAVVNEEDIILNLPEPSLTRRGLLSFKIIFENMDVC